MVGLEWQGKEREGEALRGTVRGGRASKGVVGTVRRGMVGEGWACPGRVRTGEVGLEW